MLTVTSGSCSHIGNVRGTQEDSVLDGERMWVVADGMGGHAAGDVASRMVVERLSALDSREDLQTCELIAVVNAANDEVLDYGWGHSTAAGLGTTAAGVATVNVGGQPHWAIFNIGDSRVYRWFEGELLRATIDHSETEEMILRGILTEDEARNHPLRHVITRSLGMSPAPKVDLWVLPQTPGERFLICTDGLCGEVGDGVMATVLNEHWNPGVAADELVERALSTGGRDNVSVIVVNVEGLDDDEPNELTNPHLEVVKE